MRSRPLRSHYHLQPWRAHFLVRQLAVNTGFLRSRPAATMHRPGILPKLFGMPIPETTQTQYSKYDITHIIPYSWTCSHTAVLGKFNATQSKKRVDVQNKKLEHSSFPFWHIKRVTYPPLPSSALLQLSTLNSRVLETK